MFITAEEENEEFRRGEIMFMMNDAGAFDELAKMRNEVRFLTN